MQKNGRPSPFTSDRHPHPSVGPARRALNPILLDAPVIDAEGERASVFLTPASAAIERQLPLIVAGSAGLFLVAAYLASKTGAPTALVHLLTLCAFAIAAIPALESVWESLSELRVDIDVLMLLGACLAALIGSPLEGALLLFLFALSGALEEHALARTQAAIVSLHNMMPSEATVLIQGEPRRRPLNRVEVGALVLVRPGDKIPLDGEIVEGASAVNEAAITGESVPRDKEAGDAVFAGTSNVSGRLVVRVTKRSADTTFARILRLVTEARHKRANTQRLIDRIGPTYSTGVIAFSVLSGLAMHFVFGIDARDATRRAIAVLIVCSPCALIIATPVAYLAAIGAAALRGVLIKGGVFLEALAKARVVVFDKTGTLTTGEVRLAELVTLDGSDETEVLRVAGAIEAASSHPLAAAVMRELASRDLRPYEVTDLHSVAGQGVSAGVNGHKVWIGRPRSAVEHIGESYRAAFEERVASIYRSGRGAAALVIDEHPNILVFEDTIRPAATATVARLRASGMNRVEMLTGDHRLVADALASQLDIDGFRAELLPEQKQTVAEELRREHGAIVMVGDGVNDAPALASADVGIAIGSIGADVALEAADIVLMNNNIDGVAWVRDHARRTSRIVYQNLTFAIGVIVVLAGFALAGKVALPLAVIGHEGSTVLVAMNALRLLKGGR